MNKVTQSFYNRVSLFYPIIEILLKTNKNILITKINGLTEGHLLEVGIGSGGHLRDYQKHQIIGIDTSHKMLKQAQRRKTERCELLLIDGEKLDFGDEQFDYVVLSHVAAVVDNTDIMMAEVERVMKKGGKLIILNHFTPDNFLKYFDRFFHIFSFFLCLRSFFRISDLAIPFNLTLMEERNLPPFSYFKLLTYQKK